MGTFLSSTCIPANVVCNVSTTHPVLCIYRLSAYPDVAAKFDAILMCCLYVRQCATRERRGHVGKGERSPTYRIGHSRCVVERLKGRAKKK
jgi:hypothetical protein